MKKIIALYNPGRLANQLWLAVGLYAFCLEKGYQYCNYAFYNYQHFYKHVTGNYLIDKIFPKLPHKLGKGLYLIFIFLLRLVFYRSMVFDRQREFLLPPTLNANAKDLDVLDNLHAARQEKFYFWGWLFRNPTGLEKYRQEIRDFFSPSPEYWQKINACLNDARDRGEILIGVHVRHGDFKLWQSGKYFFSFQEVKKMLDDFLTSQTNQRRYVFIICSDENIDSEIFAGLNYVVGPGDPISDLYTLSQCQAILGPGGTYGPWAAYYGNIPFIYFSHDAIDWPKL